MAIRRGRFAVAALRLGLLVSVCCLATLYCLGVRGAVGAPQEDELSEVLQTLWDGFDSIEFRTEVVPDGKDPAIGSYIIDWAMASGGRHAYRVAFEQDERGPHWLEDSRYDGSRRIDVFYLSKEPTTVSSIEITNYTKTERQRLAEVHWLLIPDGEPLIAHLKQGAAVKRGPSMRPTISRNLSGDRSVECELDPAHDYLPVRVTLSLGKDRRVVYQAEEFGRDNGRWFPIKGNSVDHREGSVYKRAFTVSDLRINRQIDPSRFAAPKRIEDGVVIHDQTVKDRKKRSIVKGGPDAKSRFVELHKASFSEEHPSAVPIRASQAPGGWVGLVVIGFSVATLVAAAVVQLRRR